MTTSTPIRCSTCFNHFPGAAQFCPYCGAEALAEPPVAFNRTLVNALVRAPAENATIAIEAIDESFRGISRHGVRIAVAALLLLTVVAGVLVGSWLSITSRSAPAMAGGSPEVTEMVQGDQGSDIAPKFWVAQLATSFEIVRNAEVVHTVSSAEGSRYDDVVARAKAVDVRLRHAAEKTGGRFAARVSGENYEVIWTDGETDFRVMDVTPADAKLSESSPDVVANLLVDRLNADRPVPNS